MGGNVSPVGRVHSSYRDHPVFYLMCSAGSLPGGGNADGVKVTIHLSLVPKLLKVWSFTSPPPKHFQGVML